MTFKSNSSRRHARMLPIAAVVAGFATTAQAGVVELGNGVDAIWSLNASFTTDWRAGNADPSLIGKGDGGTGSGYTASPSDKNFAKGDTFSQLLRVIGDVNVRKDDSGFMLRAKLWDNFRLKNDKVDVGAPSNGYVPGAPLSDKGFDTRLSRFSGAALLDVYAYTRLDLSDDVQAKLKLGSHVVNFGESLFVPGVNQYSVLDVNALRQPGTLIKEAILPVPQVSANIGLPGSASLEAFYQLQWERSSLDGCGTYWSAVTALNCGGTSTPVASDAAGSFTSPQYWNGIPALGGLDFRFSKVADRKPGNDGQFGLALKKTVEALDAELGAYFVQYSAHTPNLSAVRDTTLVPGSIYYLNTATRTPVPMGSIFWDYSADKIKVMGLSASTVFGGWAVASEASYTMDYPVQINPVDAFLGLAQKNPAGGLGVGPVAARFGTAAAPLGSGAYLAGYDRKNKSQLQVSTIKQFPNVLGAAGANIVGEVAYQHWSGIGDPYTSVRYGRGFEYGAAAHATLGGACPAQATNPVNCTQDGYFTPTAYGARVMMDLDYPDVVAGINLKPRLFLSKDIRGWSADNVFSQDRHTIALGLRAEYLHRYYVDLSATQFNRSAHFDSLHDRGFYGFVFGASL